MSTFISAEGARNEIARRAGNRTFHTSVKTSPLYTERIKPELLAIAAAGGGTLESIKRGSPIVLGPRKVKAVAPVKAKVQATFKVDSKGSVESVQAFTVLTDAQKAWHLAHEFGTEGKRREAGHEAMRLVNEGLGVEDAVAIAVHLNR